MFVGCIGGEVGTAVALAIGGETDLLSNLTSLLSGCIAGAGAALVPLGAFKTLFSTFIGLVLTSNLPGVFGSSLTQDAATAGVDLSPYNTGVQDLSAAFKN